LRNIWEGLEDEDEDVSSDWMTLRKREDLEFGRGMSGLDCLGNSLWKGP
jgi:hypothetical protein